MDRIRIVGGNKLNGTIPISAAKNAALPLMIARLLTEETLIGAGIGPVTVTTVPFPGCPTDLQAQLMALMVHAQGASKITETVFENRFMHVHELARLGAKMISLNGETARIDGIAQLRGAPVMTTDLRASVSRVVAGFAAEGKTMVNQAYHLDRRFERLEEKLKACGASIERIGDYGAYPCA